MVRRANMGFSIAGGWEERKGRNTFPVIPDAASAIRIPDIQR
jgi:hypothetical protein